MVPRPSPAPIRAKLARAGRAPGPLVIETRDRDLLERVLRREEVWAAYALGDLDDAHFARTRWFLADPRGSGTVLVYSVGGHTTAMTFGEARSVAAMFSAVPLPERFDLHMPRTHRAARRVWFDIDTSAPSWRACRSKRVSTRTLSHSNDESVGWWMLGTTRPNVSYPPS
jgi:hypothetical protein